MREGRAGPATAPATALRLNDIDLLPATTIREVSSRPALRSTWTRHIVAEAMRIFGTKAKARAVRLAMEDSVERHLRQEGFDAMDTGEFDFSEIVENTGPRTADGTLKRLSVLAACCKIPIPPSGSHRRATPSTDTSVCRPDTGPRSTTRVLMVESRAERAGPRSPLRRPTAGAADGYRRADRCSSTCER